MSVTYKKFVAVLFFIMLATLVVYLYVLTLKIVSRVKMTDKLIENTATPYERIQPSDLDILVLGDSLAYGVGNSSPSKSFPGLIGEYYPKASITNKATVGDITRDLAESIEYKIDQRYDLIVIIIGGNDIIHYGIDLEESKQNLNIIYKVASKSADQVITITSGDFKNVTLVPPVFEGYFSKRSKVLRDYSITLSQNYQNIAYVDTFEQDARFYRGLEAADHIHLNDEGTKKLFEAFLEVKSRMVNTK